MSDAATAPAPEAMQMPPPGSFVWHELTTPDPEKAKAFFGGLLGWTFRTQDMGEMGMYTICSHGGRDFGGMMKMEGPMWDGIPPHWMNYINVPDIHASARKVEELGGKVCHGPFLATGVGWIAVINDPTGAVISLIQFTPHEG